MCNGKTIHFQGGTLVEYDGTLRLLEIAQVPKEHVGAFFIVDISRHSPLHWRPLIIISHLHIYILNKPEYPDVVLAKKSWFMPICLSWRILVRANMLCKMG